MHKFRIEVTRFAVAGFANFALTFLIFFLLINIFSVNYLVSLAVVWIVGILFSYILNYLWVFQPEERLRFRNRFAKYLMSYFISFGINIFALRYVVENIGVDPFYAQAALMPIIVAFNFTTSKFWSLRHPKLPGEIQG